MRPKIGKAKSSSWFFRGEQLCDREFLPASWLESFSFQQLDREFLVPASASQLRLWAGCSSAAADPLRYLAAGAPRYLTGYLSPRYLTGYLAPGYHCSSTHNVLLLSAELCNISRMVDLEPDIELGVCFASKCRSVSHCVPVSCRKGRERGREDIGGRDRIGNRAIIGQGSSSSPFCQFSSENMDIGQLCDMSSQKTFHSHHLNRLLFKLFLLIACSWLWSFARRERTAFRKWELGSWVSSRSLTLCHESARLTISWYLDWLLIVFVKLLLIVFVKLNQNGHKYWVSSCSLTLCHKSSLPPQISQASQTWSTYSVHSNQHKL